MKELQKVIKYIAIAFGLFLTINIIAGIAFGGIAIIASITGIEHFKDNLSAEDIDYSEKFENVENLSFELTTSNLIIKQGSEFKVEGLNIQDTTEVLLDGKTLKIKEYSKKIWNWGNTENSRIIVYIPAEFEFVKVNIKTGAGAAELEGFKTQDLDLEFGAGSIDLRNIYSENTQIKCGVGEVNVEDASFSNLDLKAGVGKLEFEGFVYGKSNIECGVGELDLDLKGGKSSYSITTKKGLGEVEIDSLNISDNQTIGDGINELKIKGGIGKINIKFE